MSYWELCLKSVMVLLGTMGIGGCVFWLVAHKKRLLVLAVGVAIFLFGCIVYLRGPDTQYQDAVAPSALSVDGRGGYVYWGAVNRALSSFWPSRGDYEGKYERSLLFWVFHTSAIIYVSSVVIAIFGFGLINLMFVWCRLKWGGWKTNVFWDFSNEARWVAETIKDKKSIVFALRESSRSWLWFQENDAVQLLAKDGLRWVFATPGWTRWLSRASRHFFLGPNGHENVSGAKSLVRNYQGKGTIIVYVRISAMADDDVLQAWADNLNKTNVEIVVIREESMVATQFLSDHPMLECHGIKVYPKAPKGVAEGAFRVLLVGFGVQGERLLDNMICDAQFILQNGERVPIEVMVVDGDETSFGWYKANCRVACKRYGVTFVKQHVGNERFWNWMRCQPAFGRIVVCMKDDRENITIAHDIARLYKMAYPDVWKSSREEGRPIVYAQVRDALINEYVCETYEGRDAPFLTFGSMKEIYDFAILVENKWKSAAIWINWLYNNPDEDAPDEKFKSAAEKEWRKTRTLDRESSFASAFHQRNLLRLLGYKLREGQGEVPDAKSDKAQSDEKWNLLKKDELEGCRVLFSKIEHLRWMAFHLVRGIECWCPTEKELQNLKSAGRKIKANMLLKTGERPVHAALVEFDELPKVDALFNGVDESCNSNLQNYDDSLTNGFKAIKAAGFDICKES